MDKIRYSEKNYLCEYDLSLEFFNELGIKVNDIYPLRKVFIISTDKGNKILKKVSYDEKRVNLINDSLNYIKNNYKNVISYYEFNNGLCYKKWNDDIYIIMDILDGREASFANPVEINLCAKNIALMHNASHGVREFLKNKYELEFLDNSLNEKYKTAYEELLEIKNIVKKYRYKNEFDDLFINNVDKYLDEIKLVVEKLKSSNYEDLRKNNDLISVCHNDLAYHNFLVKNTDVNIIDFDFMSIDLRIMDVSNFLLKAIKNVGFDINKMMMALNSYEEINILTEDEKNVLGIMLKFPKDFYTITRDYYYRRKKWEYSIYLNRFTSKMNNEQFRYNFLDEYENNELNK